MEETAGKLEISIKTHFAPGLRLDGFSGSGRRFHRVAGDLITPTAFESNDYDFRGFHSTKVRMALTLARLRQAQGRQTEAIGFANIGLANVRNAIGARRDLEAILANASSHFTG